MKNRRFTLSAIALIISIAITMFSTSAFANIDVIVNGNSVPFDVEPITINDRTMVPMRAIFEALGATVEWDEEGQAVYAQKDENFMVLVIGTPYLSINDDLIKLDVAPIIINDRTMVPLRAVSEAFNLNVTWDENSQTVLIGNNDATENISPIEPSQEPEASQTPQDSLEMQVLDLVNQYRTEAGLGTLSWDDDLAAVAYQHSQDMANRDFFSHTNPDGLSPFDRMKNFGISYGAAAENIAAGQQTAEAVMETWMNSPGHYANIMNGAYNKLGIGIAYGGSYGIYWTQCFSD